MLSASCRGSRTGFCGGGHCHGQKIRVICNGKTRLKYELRISSVTDSLKATEKLRRRPQFPIPIKGSENKRKWPLEGVVFQQKPKWIFLDYFHCLTINHKCRIWIFHIWHFLPIFVLLKLTCLVILFDLKLQVFKNSQKLTIFGIFVKLLSTQNVNVARFARNVEWDISAI